MTETADQSKRQKPATVIREEDYIQCVHCGMCLEHCPTYRVTGLETESPRGRIYLMRSFAEGKIGMTENFASHISKCLDCRACEVVCPSGVPYGRLVESAKHDLYRLNLKSFSQRVLQSFVFRFLFPSPQLMNILTKLFFLYQRLGIGKILQFTRLIHVLPKKWQVLEAMQPPARWAPFPVEGQVYAPFPSPRAGEGQGEGKSLYESSPSSPPSPAGGRRSGVHRVAFFAGCVMRTGFPGVHEATVNVLRRNGCEVIFPRAQGCCGALNVHAGEREYALAMMKANIDAFPTEAYDAILVNAAGCGSLLKEYGHLLKDDFHYREKAAAFSAKTKDVAEFLSENWTARTRPTDKKVTYQDACHLGNAQRIQSEPRKLLKSIPGLSLIEMQRPDQCCGSAGIYNVVETDLSLSVLEQKVKSILETHSDVVLSGNPGCILQLRYGLKSVGSSLPVVHLMEFLSEVLETNQ